MPVCISNIRAGRRRPGLAAQHLESLRLVRDISRGRLTDDRKGSCSVTFSPGDLAPGEFVADPGTAGSITLMVQAALPVLLFAGGGSTCALRGGTDVGFSPPLDYVQRVLRPTLGRMGAEFELDCQRRGFFPKGGGSVLLRVPGSLGRLRPLDVVDGGRPKRVDAVLRATRPPEASAAQEALVAMRRELADLAPEATVALAPGTSPGRTALFWLDVVVETTTGSLFHAATQPEELRSPGKGSGRGRGEAGLVAFVRAAAESARTALEADLSSGAAVGEHLSDQLILPMSLAAGRSRLLAAGLSLHVQTAIHISEDAQLRQRR